MDGGRQVIAFQVVFPTDAQQGLVISIHGSRQVAGGGVPVDMAAPADLAELEKIPLALRQIRPPNTGLGQEHAT